MRNNSKRLLSAIGVTLCGLLLIIHCIGGSAPAAAQVRVRVSVPIRVPLRTVRAPRTTDISSRPVGVHVTTARANVRTQPKGRLGGRVWTGGKIGLGHRPYERNGGLIVSAPASSLAGTAGNTGRGGPPPPGERRFVPDEVIVEFSASASPQAIALIARRYNLTQLEAQSFPLIGARLYRWRIGRGRSVPSIVNALLNQGIVASAQPNYLFALQEDAQQPAASAQGDPAQYVLSKLQVEEAQKIATGTDVAVAVIDSEIDAAHPDLNGSVVKSFDALSGEGAPQLHGTEMAGAIFSHGKLLGIAPGAELLAARAFDDRSSGTSFAIYKSLQWAADNAARVVNMSFAGPEDPTLHRMLAAAFAKDVVLVAAAGNAGPQSPPLYPAADPDVIAVTATDVDDHLFKMANRGKYITVAAPGVDILALAPGDAYQITTGTSVAAAHVSGIAALLLQHDPSLKPADVRNILTSTAKPLEVSGAHSDFGPGLVNAYRAVSSPPVSAGNEVDHEQAKR